VVQLIKLDDRIYCIPFFLLGHLKSVTAIKSTKKMLSNRRTTCFNIKCNFEAGTVYLVYRLHYRLDDAQES